MPKKTYLVFAAVGGGCMAASFIGMYHHYQIESWGYFTWYFFAFVLGAVLFGIAYKLTTMEVDYYDG